MIKHALELKMIPRESSYYLYLSFLFDENTLILYKVMLETQNFNNHFHNHWADVYVAIEVT